MFVGDIARMLAKAALSDRLGFSLANLGTGNATSVTQLARDWACFDYARRPAIQRKTFLYTQPDRY